MVKTSSLILHIAVQTDGYHDFLLSIGDNIRAARKAKGYSQEKLAELSGLDRVSVGYIEQGRRSPKLLTLYTFASVLDVHVKDFFI